MNAITPVRYTLDLFCWDVPPATKLRATLIPSDGGEWYMTPSVDRYVENGAVQMGNFLRTLEHYRDDVALCSGARISLAYFPDCQQAECTPLIPAAVMKRLAACGVGLEVCTYPHGSDRLRYGGALYFVLAHFSPQQRGSHCPCCARLRHRVPLRLPAAPRSQAAHYRPSMKAVLSPC